MRIVLFLFTLLGAPLARADWLFTWHDLVYTNFQIFQGTFRISDEDMGVSGRQSDLFSQTLVITSSRSGATFHGDPPWSGFSNDFGLPIVISFVVHDDTHSRSLDCYATGSGIALQGRIYESGPEGGSIFENGYWTYQQIPEPSCAALLIVSTAVFCAVRRVNLRPEKR